MRVLSAALVLALAGPVAIADECEDYRASIARLQAVTPTPEAIDTAATDARDRARVTRKVRSASAVSASLVDALESAEASRTAATLSLMEIMKLPDHGRQDAVLASIIAIRNAEVVMHEVAYVMVCVLGERIM